MIRHDYALQPLSGFPGRPVSVLVPAAPAAHRSMQVAARQQPGQVVAVPERQPALPAHAASWSSLLLGACVAAALIELFRAKISRRRGAAAMPPAPPKYLSY